MLASAYRLRSVVSRVPVGLYSRCLYTTAAPTATPTPSTPTPTPTATTPITSTADSTPPSPPTINEAGYELLSPVWTKSTDIVVEKAEGSWIYGTNGKKYLDFVAGIATVGAGHCQPQIVKAAQDQLGKIVHAQLNYLTHKPVLNLVNRMKDFVQLSDSDRYFFSNSGAEAIEASIKLARHATGKTNIITFEGSFHGRTIGTMSLTNSKTIYRRGYQPLMPGVFVAPYPYAYQSQNRGDENACSAWCLRKLEDVLKQQSAPEETAAIIIEPILGEGGYVPAPAAFIKGLRKICDEHKILLIFDEVQSGVGRTGKWFAFQHFDMVPDILVFGKGIANGLPLSGLIAREELHKKWIPGSHGGTFGGNAVACAAAVETINYLKADYVLENAQRRGLQLTQGLDRIKVKYPYAVGEVRGKGLMVAIEFTDKAPKGIAKSVVEQAYKQNGLLLMTAGVYEVIRFMPPLTISQDDLTTAINWFEKAVDSILSTLPVPKEPKTN